MERVVVESPYAGDVEENVEYAILACIDCLNRGESPYASHLFFTQFLDDTNPGERKAGIEAGFAWGDVASKTVVYADNGVSDGMKAGITRARQAGQEIEYRLIYANTPKDGIQ